MGKSKSLRLFSFIFGIFLLSANAITIILPMRLADQGLSYDKIGGAMSMMAFGAIILRPIIGRHSDIVGSKRYILLGLMLGGISLFLMANNTSESVYLLLNCIFGLSRGMITAVASAYTVTLSDDRKLGSSFGNLIGISTLFTCLGGIMAGILYPLNNGSVVMIIIAIVLVLSFFAALSWLPDTKPESRPQNSEQSIQTQKLFRGMDRRIVLFCIIVFIQQFTTGPLWNTFVPLHFYTVFAFSSVFVGTLMSLDEFIGSPVSLLAGKASDKIPDRISLSASYLLTAIFSIGLQWTHTPIPFMILFLLTGCFVTCSQVIIPKAAPRFMRPGLHGFEFALISTCGGIGEWLGSYVLGTVIQDTAINSALIILSSSYLIIAIICFLSYKNVQ